MSHDHRPLSYARMLIRAQRRYASRQSQPPPANRGGERAPASAPHDAARRRDESH